MHLPHKFESYSILIQPEQQTWKERIRRWLTRVYKCRELYLLIFPGMLAVFIFHYIPIVGLQIAFKDYKASLGIWGSDWVGFKHFIRFLSYPDFWVIVKNTLAISLYSLILFPIEPIFAIFLNEVSNTKLKKSIQMITYMPHFVSAVVVCSIITLLLDRSNGVVNHLLNSVGFESINFLSIPALFPSIFVWSGVWQGLGWGTIIYLSALSSVSPELTEAAKIDGATRMQCLWHINIPSILPTAIILLILKTGTLLAVGREKTLLLQNPLNLSASRVLSTYVYEVGLGNGQFSYSTAIGLFESIVAVILIIIVNQISKKVTETSLW